MGCHDTASIYIQIKTNVIVVRPFNAGPFTLSPYVDDCQYTRGIMYDLVNNCIRIGDYDMINCLKLNTLRESREL